MLTSGLGNVTAHHPPRSVQAGNVFTKTHSGNSSTRAPAAAGPLLQGSAPTPGPQIVCPSRLTGAGVVHVPIVDQHFVKEDNAPITGERLLCEPRRERHQRRHWNREHESVHRLMVVGAWEAEADVPVLKSSLTILFCLQVVKHPGTQTTRDPDGLPCEMAVRAAELGGWTDTCWECMCVRPCVTLRVRERERDRG